MRQRYWVMAAFTASEAAGIYWLLWIFGIGGPATDLLCLALLGLAVWYAGRAMEQRRWMSTDMARRRH